MYNLKEKLPFLAVEMARATMVTQRRAELCRKPVKDPLTSFQKVFMGAAIDKIALLPILQVRIISNMAADREGHLCAAAGKWPP